MHWTPRSNSYPLDRAVLDRVYDSSGNNINVGVHNMGWAAMDYKIGRTPFLPMDVLSFATYHQGIRERILLNNRAFDGCNHPGKKYRGCYSLRSDEEQATYKTFSYEGDGGAFYLQGTENLKPELENLTASEFIDFVFLTALGRRADATEKTAFLEEGSQAKRDYIREDDSGVLRLRPTGFNDEVWENRTDDFAEIMLDYISRLPEFYYYKAVQ